MSAEAWFSLGVWIWIGIRVLAWALGEKSGGAT